MKVLLTGSTGQLGKEIINSKPENIDLITPTRKELDLINNDLCRGCRQLQQTCND